MSPRASAAIARHEFRVMRTDPATILFVIVMPVVLVALMQRLFQGVLTAEGVVGATGAEFAVPGMAVSFVAFNAGYTGLTFFRDHGWGTWERLRATASPGDILAGKVAPSVALSVAQMLILFGLAVPLFDFHVSGSWLALAVVVLALSLCLNAFGVAITAVSRTSQRLNAISSAGGLVLATMGGAFVPIPAMPGWAQAVAPALPTYWAMRGLRGVILDGGGLGSIALPVAALLGFAALFVVLAAARFRFDETKAYWG